MSAPASFRVRPAPPLQRPPAGRTGLRAGLAALILFFATASPGVEWQDSGFHQYRIITGQLASPLGLAVSHPLHYHLGRLVVGTRFGNPAAGLNLLSGLCGALAVGLVAGLVTRLTARPVAAYAAAAALALSHSFWQMSVVTETYTLAAALLALEWTLVLGYARHRRPAWLLVLLAVNGLHVANHLLGLLPLATYGVLLLVQVARRRVGAGWLVACALAWLLTVSPYALLVLQHGRNTGDWAATFHSALFGGGAGGGGWSREVLNTTLSADQLRLALLTFGYCFPSATGLVALAGLARRARGRRRLFWWILAAQSVLITGFVARYPIRDLHTFFVPVCALTALWFGLGTAILLRRARRPPARRWLTAALVANAALPVAVYAVFPGLARERGWLREQLRAIPYRDAYTYVFCPWRAGNDSAARFARAALADAGDGGWVFADATTAFPVALTYLLEPKAPAAGSPQRSPDAAPSGRRRIFWHRRDLLAPGYVEIPPADIVAHVAAGGGTSVVPSVELDGLFPPPLTIDKARPFWRLRLP